MQRQKIIQNVKNEREMQLLKTKFHQPKEEKRFGK